MMAGRRGHSAGALQFDPELALSTLKRHGVRFVVIGGIAGRLWGSPSITEDVDICHARDPANLERLARALVGLGAKLRGAPPDVPFLLDAKTLAAGDHFTFVTRAGDLDCLGIPAGSDGFEQLSQNAVEMDLDGYSVLVASLDDLVRMKRATGRPKDQIEADILVAVREEIERAGRSAHPPAPPDREKP